MSRQARLEGLRARRLAGITAAFQPDAAAPPGAYDPSLGLPTPVIAEALLPIPVPRGLRGVFQRCGACESYMRAGVCERCSPVSA